MSEECVKQAPSSGGRHPVVVGVQKISPTSVTKAVAKREKKPFVVPAKEEPVKTVIHANSTSLVHKSPSVVPGVVRKGIVVTQIELAQRFLGTQMETLLLVEASLRRTIPDLLTDEQCALWGSDVQQRFGKLVETSMKFTASPAVKDGERHLSRLYTILEDLNESFQNNNTSNKLLFWKKKKSPLEAFRDSNTEIQQLRNLLANVLPEISDARKALESLSLEFEKLLQDLSVESLSGLYISEKCLENRSNTASILLDRSNSLLQTVAHVRQSLLIRKQTSAHFEQLTVQIYDGVLNALPAWTESVTSTINSHSQSETHMYGLLNGLNRILEQLK